MRYVVLFFLVASTLYADTITGTVIKVYDGDTITVEDAAGDRSTIRLLHIDAPEKRQEFGKESTAALQSKVYGQEVVVNFTEYEVYHRILGDVFCNNRWINREMVIEGWAWQNRQYSKELVQEETTAKRAKVGLWSRDRLTPSWIWRLDQKIQSMSKQREKLIEKWEESLRT